jgi:hypothetical protein
VIGVEAQFSLAVVEKGLAAIGAHRAQVERQFPFGRVRRRARDLRANQQGEGARQ